MVCKRLVALSALLVAFVASSTFAREAREFPSPLRRVLQKMPADGKGILRDVSLGRDRLETIELERMEVWAKDGKIVVFGPTGEETILKPPTTKYFKGRVVGEDESAVFFSLFPDGTIRGMVLIGERRWDIGSGIPRVERQRALDRDNVMAPILISEVDAITDTTDPAAKWECFVDQHGTNAVKFQRSDLTARAIQKPVANAGDVAGATYQLRIAVETDDEFCAAFSNDSTTITNYVTDLIGKASTVYSRDIKTTLVLGQINIRNGGAGTDPWTVTTGAGTDDALVEFGTYWHNNYSLGYPDPDGGGPATVGGGTAVARSSAVFLSGKNFGGGIAWIFNSLCSDNFFCGADGSNCSDGPDATYANKYGGAYAFNGSSGAVETSVPDPDATVNGVQYGLPVSNYWMLLEVMHELGHNANAIHTHCVGLDTAEQTLYGRAYVDLCLSGECYVGATSAPSEKGTIMSYCHNITSGGFRQSRYLFGKSGEASFKMLGTFNDTLEDATPNAVITTQSEPVACSSGRTASVAACSGCTYAWQISGGTITSATNISSITYTPSATNVTLTATIIKSRGCGITASKTITTSCGAVAAPTGVVATALSESVVRVEWIASSGAVTYNVYRSTDAVNYSLAGSAVAPTTFFDDSGRTANTAYLYKVRAVSGGESPDSNKDLATTVMFDDDPVVAQTTLIKAEHFHDLHTAVNAVRAILAMGAGTYSEAPFTPGVTTVKIAHINNIRTALDAARSSLALTAISYGETLTSGVTTIKESHITELRNGVK